MQNLVFTPDKIEMFKAKVNATCPRNFQDVVQFFERQGMSKARSINASRLTRPDLYNQFHAKAHRMARPESRPASGEVQTFSMRSKSGAPLVAFKGL